MMKFNLYRFSKKFLLLLFSLLFIFIGSIYLLDFKKGKEPSKLSISKKKHSILYSISLIKNKVFYELNEKWKNIDKLKRVL